MENSVIIKNKIHLPVNKDVRYLNIESHCRDVYQLVCRSTREKNTQNDFQEHIMSLYYY